MMPSQLASVSESLPRVELGITSFCVLATPRVRLEISATRLILSVTLLLSSFCCVVGFKTHLGHFSFIFSCLHFSIFALPCAVFLGSQHSLFVHLHFILYCCYLLSFQFDLVINSVFHLHLLAVLVIRLRAFLLPQPFYGPFSRTTRTSQCQKRTSGIYGAKED